MIDCKEVPQDARSVRWRSCGSAKTTTVVPEWLVALRHAALSAREPKLKPANCEYSSMAAAVRACGSLSTSGVRRVRDPVQPDTQRPSGPAEFEPYQTRRVCPGVARVVLGPPARMPAPDSGHPSHRQLRRTRPPAVPPRLSPRLQRMCSQRQRHSSTWKNGAPWMCPLSLLSCTVLGVLHSVHDRRPCACPLQRSSHDRGSLKPDLPPTCKEGRSCRISPSIALHRMLRKYRIPPCPARCASPEGPIRWPWARPRVHQRNVQTRRRGRPAAKSDHCVAQPRYSSASLGQTRAPILPNADQKDALRCCAQEVPCREKHNVPDLSLRILTAPAQQRLPHFPSRWLAPRSNSLPRPATVSPPRCLPSSVQSTSSTGRALIPMIQR